MVAIRTGALEGAGAVHVRFGSKADMSACPRDVRFTPNSGHQYDLGRSSVGKIGNISR